MDNDKPLSIYYPEGDRSVEIIRNTVKDMFGRFVKYPLTWIAINPDMRIELRKGRYMETFQADHQIENPLVFVVTERRKKLKTELQGRPGKELAQLNDSEKYEYAKAKLFAYSGDSMPISPEVYKNVNVLLHECTFLNPNDRKYPVHSNVQEVFDLARDAGVKRLILTHFSPRYFRKEIPALIDAANTHDVVFDLVMPERVCRFD